jgi:hypothetical protein
MPDVTNVAGTTIAEYYKLFGLNDVSNNGMKYDNEGKLYINANIIKTGNFVVGNINTMDEFVTIFSAGWDDNGVGSVRLAGWEVTKDKIQAAPGLTGISNPTYTGIYTGSGRRLRTNTNLSSSPVRFASGFRTRNKTKGPTVVSSGDELELTYDCMEI